MIRQLPIWSTMIEMLRSSVGAVANLRPAPSRFSRLTALVPARMVEHEALVLLGLPAEALAVLTALPEFADKHRIISFCAGLLSSSMELARTGVLDPRLLCFEEQSRNEGHLRRQILIRAPSGTVEPGRHLVVFELLDGGGEVADGAVQGRQ